MRARSIALFSSLSSSAFAGKSLSTLQPWNLLKKHPRLGIGLLLFGCLATVLPKASADTISGPTLSTPDSGWQDTGIGFTANVASTLTSFVFQNQGLADLVILENANGTTLDSIDTPAGNASYTVDVSWALSPGTQYYLLQTTLSNSQYASWGQSAPSDAQITLTDTGIFSNSTTPGTFGIGGTQYWAAFSDITTQGSTGATPEPGTLVMAGSGLMGLAAALRSKLARR